MKKPSTRKGYLALLVAPGFVWWAGTNLADIDNEAIKAWDMRLHSTGISESTRRNHHILLRSILRSVGPDEDGKPGKYIETLPRFPRLPKVGKKSVDAADPEDVRRLIFEVDLPNCYWAAQRQAARLAFALAAWAGLRASEVRGLRRRDVDLKRAEITVRLARCNGEESSPKSGHERVIPISTPLLKLLEARCKVLKPAEYVAARSDGQPWGDYGLCQAMARACKRLSIEGGRYHALRHYFATALFAGNTDAKTVQALLGHSSLEVTSRYAHHLKERGRRAVQVFA